MGHPRIQSRLLTPSIFCVLTAACGQQGAAFKEYRDSQGRESADATVSGGPGALPSESDAPRGGAATEQGTPAGAEAGHSGSDVSHAALGFDSEGARDPSEDRNGSDANAGDRADAGGPGFGNEGEDGGSADPDPASGGGGAGGGSNGDGEGGLVGQERIVELIQTAPSKVDLLWVIDVSGSMSEEQQYLGQNFDALINQLVRAGHNFQVGMTSTDVCDDQLPSDLSRRVCPVSYGGDASTRLRGQLVGEPGRRVLKSSDPDIVQKFKQYTALGVGGSGFEHGLYAAHLALSKVMTGQNEALLRNDAFLAVIVVSDEQDDGIGLSETDAYTGRNFYAEGLTSFRYTDDDMISYLEGIKGPSHYSISAITPVRNPDGQLCSAPHTSPKEEGTQYIQAANRTGGVVQSLCDTNWSQSLANLGRDIAAQTSQIQLPSFPNPATIKVYVDGVRISEWTYNPGNNAVKFYADHVPAEGAVMTVRYVEL